MEGRRHVISSFIHLKIAMLHLHFRITHKTQYKIKLRTEKKVIHAIFFTFRALVAKIAFKKRRRTANTILNKKYINLAKENIVNVSPLSRRVYAKTSKRKRVHGRKKRRENIFFRIFIFFSLILFLMALSASDTCTRKSCLHIPPYTKYVIVKLWVCMHARFDVS